MQAPAKCSRLHCEMTLNHQNNQAFIKAPAPAKSAATPTAAVFIGAAAPVKAIGAPVDLVPVKTATLLEAVPLGTEAVGAVPTALGNPAEVGTRPTDGLGKPVDANVGLDDNEPVDEPAVTVTMTVTGEHDEAWKMPFVLVGAAVPVEVRETG